MLMKILLWVSCICLCIAFWWQFYLNIEHKKNSMYCEQVELSDWGVELDCRIPGEVMNKIDWMQVTIF